MTAQLVPNWFWSSRKLDVSRALQAAGGESLRLLRRLWQSRIIMVVSLAFPYTKSMIESPSLRFISSSSVSI
jgi:hypothetical protein